MFLHGQSHQELGFDPISAILTASALKDIFGIGAKKKELEEIEANYVGKWVNQFPAYSDWAEYLSRPASNPKAMAAGATTIQGEYDFWRDRKDGIVRKNQIASAEDYVAWLIATYGMKDGWFTPENRSTWKNGPFVKGTKISILDKAGIDAWIASKEKPEIVAKKSPAPTSPPKKTITQPKAPPIKAVNGKPATNFQPEVFQASPGTQFNQTQGVFDINKVLQSILGMQTPKQVAPSQVQTTGQAQLPSWVLPAVIGGGALAAVMFMNKKPKRRSRRK